MDNAVDAVESTIYQQAVGGNTLAAILYLKAHRPIYRWVKRRTIRKALGITMFQIKMLRHN